MSIAWQRTYEDPNGPEFLESLDGVEWDEAPRPPRSHRCRAQTRGLMSGAWIQRCACGAIDLNNAGIWLERNSREADGLRLGREQRLGPLARRSADPRVPDGHAPSRRVDIVSDLLPGDVVTIRTPDIGGWVIRFGEWLRGGEHRDNHVAIVWRTDLAGRTWVIEGRPGGVGEQDLATYDGMIGSSNADQPKTVDQRAAIAAAAKGLLEVSYDWESIGLDTAIALRLQTIWMDKDAPWSADVAPAHVVCSSLAAWVYAHVGLAHPGGSMATVTPGDWRQFNDHQGWR